MRSPGSFDLPDHPGPLPRTGGPPGASTGRSGVGTFDEHPGLRQPAGTPVRARTKFCTYIKDSVGVSGGHAVWTRTFRFADARVARRAPWPNGSASRIPPARGRPGPAAARPVPDPGVTCALGEPGPVTPGPWGMTVTAGCGKRRWRGTIRRDGRDRPAARCATGYARSATASPARSASAPPHGRRRRGTGGSAGPPTPAPASGRRRSPSPRPDGRRTRSPFPSPPSRPPGPGPRRTAANSRTGRSRPRSALPRGRPTPCSRPPCWTGTAGAG